MTSPFKFLDAYGRDDRAIYFGRCQEIADLYCLVFEGDLVLVYGQSGTGKTSLIQCGLANRFQPTDWFQVYVRRQEDINISLEREIRAHAVTEIAKDSSTEEAVRSLYLDHLRPVFLIFDQFEELFVLGSAEEQDKFIATIAGLLDSNAACKIVISLREEYLAQLHHFEKKVPTLFDKRLRVEPMSNANVLEVIVGTTAALGITLEHGEDTAQKIIDNLDDPRSGVQLAYLQVYLDRLYRKAAPEDGGAIVFTDQAVAETGKLGDILEDFLSEQSDAIQARLAENYPGIDKDAVQQILEAFVTLDGTRQPVAPADLAARLPRLAPAMADALAALQAARILRSADTLLELAHDSLAARIADRRSAERKALLMVEKLVRDRMAAFEQTHTWLNRDELVVVRRVEPQLGLTEAESGFVRTSARKARWSRIRRIVGWSALPIFVLLVMLAMVLELSNTDEAVVREHNDLERLSRSTYAQLAGIPNSQAARAALIAETAQLHGDLALAHNGGLEGDDFWGLLYSADLEREKNRIGEALKRYQMLADALDGDQDNGDFLTMVKWRAVYARLAELERDPAKKRKLQLEMLSRLGERTLSAYVDFGPDIEALCKDLGPNPKDAPACTARKLIP